MMRCRPNIFVKRTNTNWLVSLLQKLQHLAILIITVLVFFSNESTAQVYNYIAPNHFNIETNPSILSSEKYGNKLEINQINSFRREEFFNFSNVNLSYLLKSHFTGLGVSFTNVGVRDKFSVNNLGIGAGYRNVLFDVVYIRLGAFYKLNFCNSADGSFDMFSFIPQNSILKDQFASNLNLSMSVSSAGESYFVSFSRLNIPLTVGGQNKIIFPGYYIVNIGNAASFFYRENSLIAYSFVYKTNSPDFVSGVSHYIQLSGFLPVTRRVYLEGGLVFGYVENQFFGVSPHIKLYSEKIALKIALNLYPDKMTYEARYNSTFQISLNYLL